MAIIFLSLFCLMILISLLLSVSIIYALISGMFLFGFYAWLKGFSLTEVLLMCVSGIKTAKNILFLLLVLGMLTALWRTAGTIPYMIRIFSPIIQAKTFLLICFILNCIVSLLTGTALGTAATSGAICMAIGNSFAIAPEWIGGAILSGVYFGNRISPVSSIFLLVSSLTKTDFYKNIKTLFFSTIIPFSASALIYFAAGIKFETGGCKLKIVESLGTHFSLSFICLLPAFVMLFSSIIMVKIQKALIFSIISAFVVSWLYQKNPVLSLFRYMIFGFKSNDPALGKMINGGGIKSMLLVVSIVLLASAYGGIFKKTEILLPLKNLIKRLSYKVNPYFSTLFSSIIISSIICNQTLSVILTEQVCASSYSDKEKEVFAKDLSNSAVVTAPLIPWSVVSGTAMASCGAPLLSIKFVFFLYLVILFSSLSALRRKISPAPN